MKKEKRYKKTNLKGTTDRPRLSIYRSLRYIYAQIINDDEGKTICAASSLSDKTNNIDSAKKVGKEVAQKALEKGIKKVVFDRGRFPFHGKVKAVADASREGGLDF